MTNDSGELNKEMIQSWLELAYGDPDQVKQITLPVLSGSMAPTILPGDSIVVKHTSPERCRIGDIVVFRQDKHLTAHRMLLKITVPKGTYIFQKGDSNRFGNWIKSDLVVGIVSEAIHISGQSMQFTSESERQHSLRMARWHIFLDCIERILYLPRLLVPRRMKMYIKQFFQII